MSPWIANRPEEFARRYAPGLDEVCISITEPGRAEPAPPLPGFLAVLRLEFMDMDPARGYPERDKRPRVYFTREQARQVADFATTHRGRNILVHCAAGISRSGAIVEAILQAFPEYEDRGWPRHPNKHVKILLKRALGIVPLGAEIEAP